MSAGRRVVWVSTGLTTRGGVASYVRTMSGTPLWERWGVRHVATHQDGSAAARVLRFARGAVTYWWLLLARRPDVVHLHSASYGSFARKSVLLWSARAVRVPVVLHIHGGAFADFHDALPALGRRYVRATLGAAAAVVALGPTWADRLRAIAPRARVLVVPNAVRPQEVGPPRAADAPLCVLFLGLLSADKGVYVLLEAWEQVVRRLPPGRSARLVLAGNGDVEGVRADAERRGLAHTVELPGWVSPERVDALLAGADVLVLPSRWEGHPMAVLEAMARGVCVVATRVGGIPDLVDDGSGVLVPPEDPVALAEALGVVLQDPGRRRELGEGGRQRVCDHFDLDVTWRRLDELYTEVVR